MATKKITKFFQNHLIEQLNESVSENANTIYFVCAGKTSEYEDEANTPAYIDTDVNNLQTFREIIHGKKITPADVKFLVKNNVWTSNTIYDFYDDQSSTLSNSTFYVTSEESGDYHIFKCISNYNGAASVDQPLFSETSANDTIYQTSDGYVWKYMYSVSSTEYQKFASAFFMPVIENTEVSGNAVAGAIENFVITTEGQNMNNYANGSFANISVDSNDLVHWIQSDSFTLSSNTDFFSNCTIYLSEGTGAGQIRTVSAYQVNGTAKEIILDSEFSTTPDATTRFKIGPKIHVTGDGTGAEAFLNIDASANSAESIDVIAKGSGYTYATASISANTGESNNESISLGTIRPIISPYFGHGSDPKNELCAAHIIMGVTFANTEANVISTNTTFRTISVLKDPLFAEVDLSFVSDSTFLVGEVLVQSTTNSYGTIVSASGNTAVLTDVYGFFEANTVVDIVGQTSNNINQVTVASINNATESVFEQRQKMIVVETFSGANGTGFEIGETVSQSNTTGVISDVYLNSGSEYTVWLSEIKGTFAVSNSTLGTINTITGASSGAIANVQSTTAPALKNFSGELLYIENIDPVTRGDDQNEIIKVIIGI